MQRLVQSVENGRCPADDFADLAISNGIESAVLRTGAGRSVIARETLARDLDRARQRTLALTDFDDAELHRQYNPLMSPLVWDLAHIGQQEELWLLRDGDPHRPGMLPPNIEGLYDAFVHTRASRVDLPLLSPAQSRAYCSSVRAAALEVLDPLPDRDDDDEVAFRFGLVISHENQHDETMLQALNLRSGAPILAPRTRAAAGTARRWPARRCWCPVDRSSSVSMRRPNRCHWTTSGPPTSSTCRPSGSAGCRSPTASGGSSSTTAATRSRGGGPARMGASPGRPT